MTIERNNMVQFVTLTEEEYAYLNGQEEGLDIAITVLKNRLEMYRFSMIEEPDENAWRVLFAEYQLLIRILKDKRDDI